MKRSDDKSRREIAPGGSLDRLAVPIGVRTPNSAAAVWSRRQRRCPRPMPIVFAFCRTAASVRFIAFATCATGVLAFEWALSSRKSSLVHGCGRGLPFSAYAALPCRLVDATQLLIFGSRASYYERKKNPPGPEPEK